METRTTEQLDESLSRGIRPGRDPATGMLDSNVYTMIVVAVLIAAGLFLVIDGLIVGSGATNAIQQIYCRQGCVGGLVLIGLAELIRVTRKSRAQGKNNPV